MRTRVLITTAVAASAGMALLAGCGGGGQATSGAALTGSSPSVRTISPAPGGSSTTPPPPPPPSTSPGASATNASSGACTSAELTVTAGPSQGQSGMQKSDATFTLTNKGTRSCTLEGFPGVSFVTGDNGTQVGAPARRNDAVAPQLVTLAPGAGAATVLLITAPEAYDPAECKSVDVRGLRIYPPGETAALFLDMQTHTCSGEPQGSTLLSVNPVGVLQ
ncbi:DUF4232 domain-containing protein [Umezawaea sp. Da 62-37]|uniref:DUF4232 domain-containing protein n=1 Tax=Umezawaea sp. Da 62-37 TaxID=3075927 RepID=UPI0028F6E04C|nr:DUF4232 domain-containing protein [Umezawaea sp. Da 62-37]WNV86803.1 DUF4232 domain-containing protein [Umezawaea sp. Da 62-37]